MCYADFIGIRSCGEESPSRSGLFVDDLEGISVQNAAEIVSKDPDGLQFLKDKIEFGVRDYAELVLLNLERQEPICFDSCEFTDTFLEPSIDLVGVSVTGNFGALSVTKMRGFHMNVKDSGIVNITVTDGITSETRAIVATPGVQFVDWDFTPQKTLTIYGENTLEFSELKCSVNIGCVSCTNCMWKVDGYENGNIAAKAYGFKPIFCAECDFERAMCTFLPQIQQGALYHVGMKILQEYQISTRLSYLTLNSKEWIADKIEEWGAKAGHFASNNTDSINRYIQRIDENCFLCKKTITAYARP